MTSAVRNRRQAARRHPARFAVALLVLAGCAAGAGSTPGQYDFSGIKAVTYKGQQMTPTAALDAMRRAAADAADHVPPASGQITGSARIVLPDHDRLRVLAAPGVKPPSEGGTNFVAAELQLNLRETADAVARSRVFSTLATVEQNDTANPGADGADYLLWFQVASVRPNNAGPWVGRWLMKRPGSSEAYPITSDPGTAAGAARLTSFVQSVQLAASAQSGVAAAGTVGGHHAVSAGSGIVVDAQGHVLTNNHVIANCPDVRVDNGGGNASTSAIIAGDATNDLALLKTERRWPAWARFRDSRGLRAGESLIVTGFPLTGLVSPEMAVTTGSLTALAGLRGDTRQLQFSAPIQPGNSGGPVLDDSGRVVGVASSILTSLGLVVTTGLVAQNANFAIKSDTAREFLDANHVSLDQGAGRGGLSAPAIGDLARKFTVRVECWR